MSNSFPNQCWKCGFKWNSKVEFPKRCPNCNCRMKYPKIYIPLVHRCQKCGKEMPIVRLTPLGILCEDCY
jgi:hypothetical protein